MASDLQHPSLALPSGSGVIEDDYDKRDFPYTIQPGLQIKTSCNLRTESPANSVPIYDQGNTGTCTANSTSVALWYELKKASNNVLGDTGPSRMFIYWNERTKDPAHANENPLLDTGSQNRYAIQILNQVGCCSENGWKWDTTQMATKPGQPAFDAAKNCLISSYMRLDDNTKQADQTTLSLDQMNKAGEDTLLNLRACLSEGYPVIFSFYYNTTLPNRPVPLAANASGAFQNTSEGYNLVKDLWANNEPHHVPLGNVTGGHSICAIGYDDQRRIVICQNSWGLAWGNGFICLPYSWILDYPSTKDFWTIRH